MTVWRRNRNRVRVICDLDRHLPFTTASALAAGMSVDELEGDEWRAVLPDVWISSAAPLDRATWRDAARLVLPADAVLCGLSALAEHGLDLRPEGDVAVHVSAGVKHRRRSPELVCHRLAVDPTEVSVIGRWLVTTPQRSAFDCVRWADPALAADTADGITRSGLAGIADLVDYAERYPRLHGTRQVRLAVVALGGEAAA